MMRILALLCVLILPTRSEAWQLLKGYSDVLSPSWTSIPAASCIGGTATPNWNTPASDAPVAACIIGTNTIQGVLDFDDGTASTAPSIQLDLILSPDWIEGNGITLLLKWLGTDTNTGHTTRWCAQASCVADAETNDPAFQTAVCVNDAAKGTSAQSNDTSISLTGTSVATCAGSELLHLKIYRDSDHASDTTTGNARLLGVRLGVFTTE